MSENKDKLDEYKNDVAKDYDVTEYQREKANEDMRFCSVDGGQWEEWLHKMRGYDSSRAMLELDITSDYVERFYGEYTQNRVNVTYTPEDDATTDDDADLLNSIYRADFRDNKGRIAQDNAVREVAICGVGAFKLQSVFEDEEDPENDKQKIIWKPIHNAYNHVMWDANAKSLDKDDANHCTEIFGYTKDAFEKEFADREAISAYEPEHQFNGFYWRRNELIYVAKRYEIRKEKTDVEVFHNIDSGQIQVYEKGQAEEMRDELNLLGWEFSRARTLNKQRVYVNTFSGKEFLGQEDKRIAGKYIPIIPMYGFRTYVDGVEHCHGLVRKRKDAQRLFNAGASRIAESAATSGDRRPIFMEEQIDTHEDMWADKTKGAYRVLNAFEDENGKRHPLGPVGYEEPPVVDPNTMQTVQIASDFIQRTTGNAPQDSIDPDASGKAINALRKRENLNTTTISDNIVTGIRRSGLVYQSMAAEVYAMSRVKRSMAADGTPSIVTLSQSKMDERSGSVIEINDLSKGKYQVDVEVGPQYESQKEAERESIEAAMSQITPDNEYFTPMMAMWIDSLVGTGFEPLKKFNRRKMLLQGLVEPENEEEKQMLANAQQQQDPQEDLVKAAAQQQLAEAENLKASSLQKMADAGLKKAQTAEKVTDIGIKKAEAAINSMANVPKRLKFDMQTGRIVDANSRTA